MKGIVVLLDENKNKVKRLSITRLPFKKEKIIQKSIELYGEANPCAVYYAFCSKVIGEYILNELNKEYSKLGKIVFNLDECPEYIKDVLDDLQNDGVKFLEFS